MSKNIGSKNIGSAGWPAPTRRAVLAALGLATALMGMEVGAALAQPKAPPVFVLYFPYAGLHITHTGEAVVSKAAAAAKDLAAQGQLSHVKVIGYADTTGSEEGAQHLSERRAEMVRQALIAEGLPADKVASEGRGKHELAVQTGDQVRELRNRRVRIVLYRPGD